MCAKFKKKGKLFKPGKKIFASGKRGPVKKVWAGFARSEILDWWKGRGGLLLDIPATHFAERSDLTGKLHWGDIHEGLVIRGLLEMRSEESLIRVVTRAALPDEIVLFGHPRMPLLEAPLFDPLPDHLFDEEEEPDLFGLI
jgi:hypothetical protein